MKNSLFVWVLVLLAALSVSSPAFADPAKPGLFVIVTSENAEVQGMAMVLSIQSVQHDAAVRVLLCGPGGDLAVKGAPQTALKPKNITPQAMMGKLLSAGVTVEVCALYLPNSGKSADDLIEGVGVAKPPAIASALLAPNTKLFTF